MQAGKQIGKQKVDGLLTSSREGIAEKHCNLPEDRCSSFQVESWIGWYLEASRYEALVDEVFIPWKSLRSSLLFRDGVLVCGHSMAVGNSLAKRG